MIGLLLTLLIWCFIIIRWVVLRQQHEQRLQQIPIRIHVNGIRGKSTVTRLIAGMLREAGLITVAKTTGSAARVIFSDGTEAPIERLGAATITEQTRIIRENTTPQTDALVIECMAVNPLYQKVTQERIVKGTITVITNVREDHQDLMGESLAEIADSLSNTIPQHGLLVSAEDRPELREQLTRNAAALNSEFLFADAEWVTDKDLQRFDYLTFKENLAIGLAIAQHMGIPREVAMRGMSKALPDIGSVFIERAVINGKNLVWAPLFAVNDRESTLIGLNALRPYHAPDATRIGILNNRYDRAVRAMQFAEIAANDLNLDYYITFGAYERQVTDRMIELGVARQRVINLGDSRKPTLDEILNTISDLIETSQGLLVGMVNIHTEQAELLLHHFQAHAHQTSEPNFLTANLRHLPNSVQRQRYLFTHLLKTYPKGKGA